jgi:acyl carrier protein
LLADLEEVCRTVGLVLGRRNVAAAQRLVEDLGAESADILNIVVTLEQKYSVKIDDAEMGSVATVADLHAILARLAHARQPADPDRTA